MTEKDDGVDTPPKECGITDEDIERIKAYLEKPQFERSVDNLRPSSEE